MDFKSFLELYGYTNSSFARKYGIKLRTVENWSYRGCPEIIFTFIVNYESLLVKYNNLVADYNKIISSRFTGGVENDKKDYLSDS